MVPELPGYNTGFDYGPGGFCVNAAGGLMGPGNYIYNMVRSPAIAIPAGEYQDVLFLFEEYIHQVSDGNGFPVFSTAEVRSTADPTGMDGWSPWMSLGNLWYGGPGYVTREYSLGSVLVEDCTYLQVSFGARQVDWWGPATLNSSPAPYYDNVRVLFVLEESPIPTLASEPEYTAGSANTVEWSDVSSAGAVAYYAECATDAGFTSLVDNSGWIPGTAFEFTGLDHGQIYHYRVKARDIGDVESAWSNTVFSTQDGVAPESALDPLPDYTWGSPIPLAYSASDDGSGVQQIQLFFSHEGGAFVSAGTFPYSVGEPWIEFSFSAGDGEYSFYTVAYDVAGNVEDVSGLPEQSIIHDTLPPDVPSLDPEPEFTAGLANTIGWSDETSSGGTSTLVQRAEDPDFTVGVISLSTSALSWEFADLVDGQIYYFRVAGRDPANNQSAFSPVEFSTQDATAPESSLNALAAVQGDLEWEVEYTATDATSGVASVELFVAVDGGEYTSAGLFTSNPMTYTAAGDGSYAFYTVTTDAVGNVEAAPAEPDAVTVVDTSASSPPTLVAEPEFTAGLVNSVSWSDESLPAVPWPTSPSVRPMPSSSPCMAAATGSQS